MPEVVEAAGVHSTAARCLTCNRPASVRGLCPTCRSAAWRTVAAGRATEQELVELGLLLPPRRAGRPPSSGFARQLDQKRATTTDPPGERG